MSTRTLIAGLTAIAALTATAHAQPYDRPYRPYRPEPVQRFYGCTVFENINYGGARLPVSPGQFSFVGQGWNDRISSIACAPGCRLVAYENISFGGARQTFVGNVSFVGQRWNDKVSSAEIRCR